MKRSAATTRRARLALAVLLAISVVEYPLPGATQTWGGCSIGDFKTDGSIGAKFNAATQTLAYSRANAAGTFHVYLANPDGSGERRFRYAAWPENRHQYALDWQPAGNYLFVEVEKSVHAGSSRDAIPGYGAYTDLWLATRDGSKAWKIVDEPNNFDHALTHGAITPDGGTLTWTERTVKPDVRSKALLAGTYVFHVASVRYGSFPRLVDIRTYSPGTGPQGGEVDGISADGSTIAFYITYVTEDLLASRIYTWNVRTNRIEGLSTESFSQAARFSPSGRGLVYMSGEGADRFFLQLQGADWWYVSTDGLERRRLTYMNKRGNPESTRHRMLAGVISFDSDRSFYGDVLLKVFGLSSKIVKVRCDDPF